MAFSCGDAITIQAEGTDYWRSTVRAGSCKALFASSARIT
jgi:hypothetical protein